MLFGGSESGKSGFVLNKNGHKGGQKDRNRQYFEYFELEN